MIVGARVLLVEDEPIVAMTAEDMLADLGAILAGSASTLEEAIVHADTLPIDAALLDINLNGAMSLPVAERLRERGVPFAFATGYGSAGPMIDPRFSDVPVIAKPYTAQALARVLTLLLA